MPKSFSQLKIVFWKSKYFGLLTVFCRTSDFSRKLPCQFLGFLVNRESRFRKFSLLTRLRPSFCSKKILFLESQVFELLTVLETLSFLINYPGVQSNKPVARIYPVEVASP